MKAPDFNPEKLDVQALAKDAVSIAGQWPVTAMERLAASCIGQPSGDVCWEAVGEMILSRAGSPQVWLHLSAKSELKLECQRCLGPVDTNVQVERSFRFVPGEQAAAELDAESEEDVLALTRTLNLRELVEDEVLLTLPLVPRHEACPEPLPDPAASAQDDSVEKPNPFAALAALKKGKLPN